jgi:hypothetical protein
MAHHSSETNVRTEANLKITDLDSVHYRESKSAVTGVGSGGTRLDRGLALLQFEPKFSSGFSEISVREEPTWKGERRNGNVAGPPA